jgi:hypothetical protein
MATIRQHELYRLLLDIRGLVNDYFASHQIPFEVRIDLLPNEIERGAVLFFDNVRRKDKKIRLVQIGLLLRNIADQPADQFLHALELEESIQTQRPQIELYESQQSTADATGVLNTLLMFEVAL